MQVSSCQTCLKSHNLTVYSRESRFAIEPDFIGSYSNHWTIRLVESPTQHEHPAIANVIGMPYICNDRKPGPGHSRERVQVESIDCDAED